MSAAGWLIFSITCFAMAGGFLALSVLLFIRYKIPNVIGDLSGKRAAKEVAALRADSASKGRHSGHSGHTSDFKAMAIAHENKRLDKTSGDLGNAELYDDDGGSPTEDIRDGGHAELLNDPNGSAITGVLNAPEQPQFGITQVLNEKGGAYEIQPPEENRRTTEDLKRIDHFEITRSVTVIHTDEVI